MSGRPFVYIGGDDDTIAVHRMDPATAALTPEHRVEAGRHPSFLAFTPDKKFVYAVNEFASAVAAFAVDPKTGGLAFIHRIASEGSVPAYVSLDRRGKFVLVANYEGGTVAVFPIQGDGSLGRPTDVRTTGVNPHSIVTDPSNRFVFVANKGSDKISQFSFDGTRGTLTPNTPPDVATPKGAEPRHIAFHPARPFVYVIEEAGDHVETYSLDASRGALSSVASISTLPDDVDGAKNTGADLHFSPTGKFLYGSNRGHDSIVIYAVAEDGRPTLLGHQSTEGKTPRNFGIDPTGTYLFAANQDSGTLVTFAIDPERGTLAPVRTTKLATSPYWVGIITLPGD